MSDEPDSASTVDSDRSDESSADTTDPEAFGDPRDEEVAVEPDRNQTSASGGAREVTVPLRLYKTVTVFATLIAMVAVILGFVALDVATNRAQAAASEVDVWLAVLGLGSILFGAFVYAFSTRFRTREMGKPKDESDEDSDNG